MQNPILFCTTVGYNVFKRYTVYRIDNIEALFRFDVIILYYISLCVLYNYDNYCYLIFNILFKWHFFSQINPVQVWNDLQAIYWF